MTGRDDIYTALFARLSAALPSYWASRDVVTVDQCPQWPALLVNATEQEPIQSDSGNAPTVWKLSAMVALYVERADPSTAFEPVLNGAIDSVEAALAPQPGEQTGGYHTTLGDLVERAWIQGRIEIHRQPGDQKAVVLIPVEMLTL